MDDDIIDLDYIADDDLGYIADMDVVSDEEIDHALGDPTEEEIIELSSDFESWPIDSESDEDLFDIYATYRAGEISWPH